MLEKVREYALVKYAGDEALADQFVLGFVKQAAVTTQRQYDASGNNTRLVVTESPDIATKGITDFFQEGLSGALGKGLGGLAVGLGVHGLNQVFSVAERGSLHTKFLEALSKAIAMNRLLTEADKEEVTQYAETIFKFAPHVAADPNVLSPILATAVQGHKGAGLDPNIIKTLSDLESRYLENRSTVGFSPKAYV